MAADSRRAARAQIQAANRKAEEEFRAYLRSLPWDDLDEDEKAERERQEINAWILEQLAK